MNQIDVQADYYVPESSDMKDIAEILEGMKRLGSHAHILRFALQFVLRYNALALQMREV